MSDTKPNAQIVSHLELLLAAAREGRILFLLTSAGCIARGETDVAGGAPRTFEVVVGGYVGEAVEAVATRELGPALKDVVRGTEIAAGAVAKHVADRAVGEWSAEPDTKKSRIIV